MKLTEEQVNNTFEQEILPSVIAQYGKNDKPAVRQAWNDYTDSLCKDGQITQEEYDIWVSPF